MNALTEYRDEKGKTREMLADDLAVDPTTIWRWETGAVKVPAERVFEVERITGIHRSKIRPDLFGEAA